MASADRLRVAVAAVVFSVREKDYGGVHLGVAAADVMMLTLVLESLASGQPGHVRGLTIGQDPRILARQIFPGGRFLALTSLRLQRADRVRVSVNNSTGLVELTVTAAQATGDLVARVHATGGDACLVGDSGAWTDRLWLWPL